MASPQIRIRDPQSIHREASPAFYTENTFMVDDPSWALRWLEQISRANVKYLAKLRIFVPAVYQLGPYPEEPSGRKWCELFDKLAREATALREIYVYWDAEPLYWHLGGGSDVDVVRALVRITGLQKLKIDGYFAKEWPAYLEEKTGMKAWERQGQNKGYLRGLKKLQRKIKDLSP